MTNTKWALANGAAAIVLLITCVLITTAITGSPRHQNVPRAGPTPERTFDGAAYLYQDGRRFSEIPEFIITTSGKDRVNTRQHVHNLAISRHWVNADEGGWTRVYVLPDHDVSIIQEIAKGPERWIQEFLRNPPEQPPRPDAEDLMAVTIRFKAEYHQKPYAIAAGATGLAGVIAILFTAGFAVEASSEKSKSRRA